MNQAPEADDESEQEALRKCIGLVGSGELGSALRLLESLEGLPQHDRDFLRVQMLHAADLPIHAYQDMKSWPARPDMNPEAALRLALICADAGVNLEAGDFLREIVGAPLAPASFGQAITVARRIRENGLAEHFEDQLILSDPASDGARWIRRRRALSQGDFIAAAADLSPEDYKLREPLYTLQLALVDSEPPDFTKAYSACLACPRGTPVPSAALAVALSRGDRAGALKIAGTFAANPDEEEVVALLNLLDWLLLHREEDSWATLASEVESLVLSIVDHIATRPERGEARGRLLRLLAVERSANYGLPIIVSAVFRLSHMPIEIAEPHDAQPIPEELLSSGFMNEALDWLTARSPCILGRVVLPKEMLRDPPDAIVATIRKILSTWDDSLSTDEGAATFKHFLLLATAVAPHAEGGDHTVSLIRIAAIQLTMAGRHQDARDLCAQILISSHSSPTRRQAAWFAMSDIYCRTGDHFNSCLAFACALRSGSEKQNFTGWLEWNTWARVLRSLEFFDWAREALNVSNEALNSIGRYESAKQEQEFLGLTIDTQDALTSSDYANQLPALIDRVCNHAGRALAGREGPDQILILLNQLIDISVTVGQDVPSRARHIRDTLAGLPMHAGNMATATNSEKVTPELLFELYRSAGDARYSDDAARDASTLAALARNFLTLRADKVTAEELIVAFELCADSGVAAPAWTDIPRPPARLHDAERLRGVSERLRERGIALVMGTLNNRGELLTLRISEGSVHLVQETGFRYRWFTEWSKKYPFAYGIETPGPVSFFSDREVMLTSLDGCALAAFPNLPTLVVFDAQLQSLPANVLVANGELIGSRFPVASAPSLTWIAESLARPETGNARQCAWISDGGQDQSLNMLVNNLAATFEEFGVEFDTSSQIPAGMGGAELAIVAAHGKCRLRVITSMC